MILRIPGYLLASLRLISLVILLVLFVPLGVLLLHLKLANQKTAFAMRTLFCQCALGILGIRKRVSGNFVSMEGALYVGNHRSLLDPLVAFSFIQNGYAISKAEVASYPLINTGAKFSGVVFVERGNSVSRKTTKDRIIELLKEKMSVIIFPEGTISITKQTLPFKKGAFEAAALNESPVIYFALEMADPDHDFWFSEGLLEQFFITFSKWKTIVFVHYFDVLYGNDGNYLVNKVQADINQKLAEFQKNWVTTRFQSLV